MQFTPKQLTQLKNIELEMLDELVRICDANGINYFLSGGTCLGAARHKGFIPWDDDIDVGMLREDYDRFAKVCKTELRNSFVFQDMGTEPSCGLVFGKIRKNGTVYSEIYSSHIAMSQGVWIDIFPYDRVSNDPSERVKQYRKVSLLKNLYIVKCGYKFPQNKSEIQKAAYYVAKAMCLFIPQNWIISKIDKAMRTYNQDESCRYAMPFGGAYSIEVETEELARLQALTPIEFEGKQYKTFADWDGYLTKHYGDYMQLPPKEKRRAGVHYVKELKLPQD